MNKQIAILLVAVIALRPAFSQTNVIGSTGAVGIGITTPSAGTWLHVYRKVTGNYNPLLILQDSLAGGFTQMALKGTARTFHIGVGNSGASFGLSNKFFIWDQNASLPRLVIDANGSMGIGTTNIDNSHKLFVEGAIRCRKLKVDQDSWPDYVFDTSYAFRSLPELEQYISIHKHLPDVPSAQTIAAQGVDVGETQATLLRKIEELTLYVIEQNKTMIEQRQRIEQLERRERQISTN